MSQQILSSDYDPLLEAKNLPHILKITSFKQIEECFSMSRYNQGKMFEFRKYYQQAVISAWNNNDVIGNTEQINFISVCNGDQGQILKEISWNVKASRTNGYHYYRELSLKDCINV